LRYFDRAPIADHPRPQETDDPVWNSFSTYNQDYWADLWGSYESAIVLATLTGKSNGTWTPPVELEDKPSFVTALIANGSACACQYVETGIVAIIMLLPYTEKPIGMSNLVRV
jgi:hypothetical protein